MLTPYLLMLIYTFLNLLIIQAWRHLGKSWQIVTSSSQSQDGARVCARIINPRMMPEHGFLADLFTDHDAFGCRCISTPSRITDNSYQY
ncbi:hypothetical protein KL909_005031 [Ogataea angusta]|nr:hypothetical protein KL909_005031 [Ogataea angusta]